MGMAVTLDLPSGKCDVAIGRGAAEHDAFSLDQPRVGFEAFTIAHCHANLNRGLVSASTQQVLSGHRLGEAGCPWDAAAYGPYRPHDTFDAIRRLQLPVYS